MTGDSESPQAGLLVPRRSGLRTFLDVLLGRLVTSALSLGAIVLTAHLAPTATTGIYTSSMGYALLLFMFLDMGSGLALVREAAGSEDRNDEIWLYIRTRALLTIVTTGLGLAIGLALFPRTAWPAMMVAMLVVLFSFAGITSAVGQVLGDVRIYRNLLVLQSTVSATLTAVALIGFDVTKPVPLVAASAAGGLIATIGAIWWVLRRVPLPRHRLHVTGVLTHLRGLAMLGLATGLSSIYARIDSILVLRINGSSDAALYGLASRILEQGKVVPATLLIPLGPFLASHHAAEPSGRSPEAIDWLARLAVSTGIALCLCLASLSDFAVMLIGGSRFSDSATYLTILSADLGLGVVSYALVLNCIMSGHDRWYLVVAGLSVGLNIALNLVVLPSHGPSGAAVITVVTEVFVMVALFRQVATGDRRKFVTRVGAASVVMVAGVVAKLVSENSITIIDIGVSSIILAGGLYAGWTALLLLRSMPRSAQALTAQLADG
jgi:O-antigen/teichoic acid export membrane protein